MAKSPNDFTKHDATDVFQNIRSINDFTAGLISDIRQNVLPPSAGATIQQIKLAQQRLRVAQRSLIKARSTTIQFNKRFNTRNFDEWGDPNTDIVIINSLQRNYFITNNNSISNSWRIDVVNIDLHKRVNNIDHIISFRNSNESSIEYFFIFF